MELEFLSAKDKKIVRTTLYNDQQFTSWELELLHTPVMQRLYNLKQLGFADKVFPDAVHSRLNHVLGVAEMAERIATRLVEWLEKNKAVDFTYMDERTGASRQDWKLESINGADLARHASEHIPVVRLIALLHDLTHAAFGHTLEDEVCVFLQKHDDPSRQIRFFDALVAQLIYLWAIELGTQRSDPDVLDLLAHLEIEPSDVKMWVEELHAVIGQRNSELLACRLRELEVALSLLTYIVFLHDSDRDNVPPLPKLLISDAIAVFNPNLPRLDLVLHRDAFFVDIVGNTICADLLDYAHRDAYNAGLRIQFDARLIRYVCNVSVSKKLSPTSRPCIRLALQFFTDKMRHDVLSEMSGILKARYLINERVLFHPTKCAAGAMLGTAVQLLGISSLPEWMQVLGDQEFLRALIDLAQRMHAELRDSARVGHLARPGDRLARLVTLCIAQVLEECGGDENRTNAANRVKGARNLLWRLVSRRYPKLVYRLRSGLQHSGGENDDTLAKSYTNPAHRFELERKVERLCNLPPGALVVHCPRRKMSMKVAEALVVGTDLSNVAHLRDVNEVTPEPLPAYQAEIKAIEDMYRAIWQLHAFLDSCHYDKCALVSEVLYKELHFPNDSLLSKRVATRQQSESVYDLLVGDLQHEFPWSQLPLVVRRLDEEGTMRMRQGDQGEGDRDRVLRIIHDVGQRHAATESALTGEPGKTQRVTKPRNVKPESASAPPQLNKARATNSRDTVPTEPITPFSDIKEVEQLQIFGSGEVKPD